jgi:hypothetical protein
MKYKPFEFTPKRKNCQIHIMIETALKEKLFAEAKRRGTTMAAITREKLNL